MPLLHFKEKKEPRLQRTHHVSEPHGNHLCLTKFQCFDFVDHNSPGPLTSIFNESHFMLFPFGNFMWALVKDKNVYNRSFFKQNSFLEKVPTTVHSDS